MESDSNLGFLGAEEMTNFVLPRSEIVLSSVFVTILSTKSTIRKTLSPFASWASFRNMGCQGFRKVGLQDLGHYSGSFAGQEVVVIEVIANLTVDFPHSLRAESPAVLLLKGFLHHVHVEEEKRHGL